MSTDKRIELISRHLYFDECRKRGVDPNSQESHHEWWVKVAKEILAIVDANPPTTDVRPEAMESANV